MTSSGPQADLKWEPEEPYLTGLMSAMWGYTDPKGMEEARQRPGEIGVAVPVVEDMIRP